MRLAKLLGTSLLAAFALATLGLGSDLKVTNVQVSVKERTGDTILKEKLEYPETFKPVPKLDVTTVFTVSFDAAAAAPDKDNSSWTKPLDQAFVNFHNAEVDRDISLIAKPVPSSSNSGSYKLDVTRNVLRKELAKVAGKCSVALVLGSTEAGGLVYPLGQVMVGNGVGKGRQSAGYGPRPEIHHAFRDPQRMPNPGISAVFSALTALPLLGMFGVWGMIGVNVKNLYREPVGSVAFLGLVVGYMAVAVAYWVGVKLFPTLAVVAVLAAPTYLVGQYALSKRIERAI